MTVPPGPATGGLQPSPVPDVLQRSGAERLSRGDVLYRLYLVVVFGGLYGSVLIHALMEAAVPALEPDALALVGLVVALVPIAAALAGVRFGRWAGPVPITRPEASILLPTPVDRRALLLPRLRRGYVAGVVVGTVGGLIAMVLLALSYQVGGMGWLVVPVLCGASGLVGGGAAAVAQTLPLEAGRHRQLSVAIAASAVVLAAFAATATGRGLFAEFGASIVGVGAFGSAMVLAAVAGVVALLLAGAGRHRIASVHDEQLRSRAGLHAGLSASVRLGDLRAIAQSRDPVHRRRRLASPPFPRRASGVIVWRHVVALRASPAPIVRCAAGWAIATLLVVHSPAEVSLSGVVLQVLLAAGAIYWGTSPLLEPLRREHDSPLTAELLPFGFATLSRLHLRAGMLMATAVGYATVAVTLSFATGTSWLGPAALVVPLAALTAVVAVADQVRQPDSLAEYMMRLPAGAPAEVLGFGLLGMLLRPVMAMLPLALPVGLAMAASTLALDAATIVTIGATIGVGLLALRVAGLRLWLEEYERALHDAELLDATSSLTLAWRRIRHRRARTPGSETTG